VNRAKRSARRSDRVLGSDGGCARCSLVDVGPRPLIRVWTVHRRQRLAAEKVETEGCHFWIARCGLGTLRVE
jgi:hypothetical protein